MVHAAVPGGGPDCKKHEDRKENEKLWTPFKTALLLIRDDEGVCSVKKPPDGVQADDPEEASDEQR